MIPLIPMYCYNRIPGCTQTTGFALGSAVAESWFYGSSVSSWVDAFDEHSLWFTDYRSGPRWCGIIGLIVADFV